MKIILTARELLDQGHWDSFCAMRGISVYAINEGQVASSEEFTLTEAEAQEIGVQKLKTL